VYLQIPAEIARLLRGCDVDNLGVGFRLPTGTGAFVLHTNSGVQQGTYSVGAGDEVTSV